MHHVVAQITQLTLGGLATGTAPLYIVHGAEIFCIHQIIVAQVGILVGAETDQSAAPGLNIWNVGWQLRKLDLAGGV